MKHSTAIPTLCDRRHRVSRIHVARACRRAGRSTRAGNGKQVDRPHRRHDAGAGRVQPLFRDCRRPCRGGRRSRPGARLRPQRQVERRLRDRPDDVQGGRHVQGRARTRSTSCRPGTCKRCGSPTTPRARTNGSLTPIDPKTGKPGTAIPVDDPYNMYFTPDGKSAIVVAEALKRLDFRDPHTMALQYVDRHAADAPASTTPTSRSTATTRSSPANSTGTPGEDRPRQPQGRRLPQAVQARHAAGHPHLARRQAASTSPT